MSLITLTFGGKYSSHVSSIFKEVSRPLDNLKPIGSNKLEVKKVSQFYGDRNVFVLGEVKAGVLIEQMKSTLGNKTCFVVELESKHGKTAKEGMTVGLTIAGAQKDDFHPGQIVEFQA